MRECGSPVVLVCTCCGETRTVEFHCKRRWCPACQPMVTARRMDRWRHAISGLQWPLFVTLTIPNSPDPDSLRNLKSAWSKLRRRKLIREKVKGGVATFEVTNKGNGWHPHIHAVCDCRWLSIHVPEPLRTDPPHVVKAKCEMAQRELSSLWGDVLGIDSAVVWVQRVKQVDQMAAEVLKYCMKGDEMLTCSDKIAPMLEVISSTRMLAGWGSLHPLPSPDEEEKPGIKCDQCGEEKSYLPSDVVSYITQRSDQRTYQAPR